MPADAHTDIIFGTEDLCDAGRSSADGFHHPDQRTKPTGYRIGFLQPLQCVVVTEPKRGDPALAFEGTELERF